MGSNISAVVLTIGEATFSECIERLKNQTLPLDEIIVIENNYVLHEAYNEGVQRVKTDYFLQCDADMLTDPDCVEVLMGAFNDDIGVSIGYLKDELLGEVQAIKLFRTSCNRGRPFAEGVTTDTDAISEMRTQGYKVAFAKREGSKHGHSDDVLAEHCPDYNNQTYTFGRFMRLGAQIRQRYCYDEYHSCLQSLKESHHPMADVALAAFCHGFFKWSEGNNQNYFDFTMESEESRFFRKFKEDKDTKGRLFAVTKIKEMNMEEELEKFNRLSNVHRSR